MTISKEEMKSEERYLKYALDEVDEKLKDIGNQINVKKEEITQFKKMLWQEKGSVDSIEMRTSLMASEMEANFMLMKMDYYKRLLKIKYSPYFGRVDFKENKSVQKIYIGITHLEHDFKQIIYDWRSPIASLFYDYGVGPCFYTAPEGDIKGEMIVRRQYKIENGKLIRVFDSNINVVDDMLQEVLSEKSNDKMKNIVNTIQQEQNEIIRNTQARNLVVQGIAGSGKTSVALHRIAFLLYKIKNLKSANVLIFSPNNVFSEYISNVLPELGESNALETTFHDFAKSYISEFKQVESFTNFIERYYQNKENNVNLVKFKLSNKMIDVVNNYVSEIEEKVLFNNDISADMFNVEKEYLNYLLKDRYSKLPLYKRFDNIAEHLCDKYGLKYKYKRNIIKQMKESINIKPDFKKLYKDMYLSNSFKQYYKDSVDKDINTKIISYDDALCFIYLKGLLNEFPYSNLIKQVVIDEAQDYNPMQYIILSKIFKTASFTILGDVNQTINPYQKYETLKILSNYLNDNCQYLELNKTYRSTPEIINYANKVLGLKHVSAIRLENNEKVIEKNNNNTLISDIKRLKEKYNSLAIITKTKDESNILYERLKEEFKDISLMNDNKEKFNKDFIIVPSYLSKGLEFDSVISYSTKPYLKEESNLFYVVVTRAQHELIIYKTTKC